MNKVYRTVWNEHTNTWVAVQETAKARGKSGKSGGSIVSELGIGGSRFMMTAAASAVLLMSGQAMAAVIADGTASGAVVVHTGGSSQSVAQGQDSTAIGTNAKVTGAADTAQSSIAFGSNAEVRAAKNAIAFGTGAVADKNNAVSVGNTAKATGQSALAVGDGASASAGQSTAVGVGTKATAAGASSFGHIANASGVHSTAIGSKAVAQGGNSVSIGHEAGVAAAGADIPQLQNAISIGNGAGKNVTRNIHGIAIGNEAGQNVSTAANGGQNIAIGNMAGKDVTGNTNVAISSRAGQHVSGHDNFAALIDAGQYVAGSNNIAIGKEAGRGTAANPLNVSDTVALGLKATGGHNGSIAIGKETVATSAAANNDRHSGLIAIGDTAKATNDQAIAVGKASASSGDRSIAMGAAANAAGSSAIAFGTSSSAAHKDGIAIGNNAKTGTGDNNTAVGAYAQAHTGWSTAVGTRAHAAKDGGFAGGKLAYAKGQDAVATGAYSYANGAASTAIGYQSIVADNAHSSTAIGSGSVVSGTLSGVWNATTRANANAYNNANRSYVGGDNNYAIGNKNIIGDQTSNTFILGNNVKLGATSATLNSTNPLGTGNDIGTRGETVTYTGAQDLDNMVALGSDTKVSVSNGVALGYGSNAATDKGQVGADPLNAVTDKTGAAWTSTSAAVAVGDAGNNITRQITGVAAGTQDADAVNVAQLKAVANQVASSATTHYYSVDDNGVNGGNYLNDGAAGINALAAGVNTSAVGKNAISVGEAASANSTTGALAIGSTYVGHNLRDTALPVADGDVTLDPNHTDRGEVTTVGHAHFGQRVRKVDNEWKREVSESVKAWSDNAIAIGVGAEAGLDKANPTTHNAGKTGAIAIGTRALAYEVASVALGEQAGAFGVASTALGTEATANNQNGVAVGSGATAEADNTVAAGFKAVADGKSAVAVGDQAWTSQAASQSLALGNLAEVQGRGQTLAEIKNQDTTKIANGAVKGVAVGYKAVAVADIEGGVALGAHSTADRSALGGGGNGVTTSVNPTVANHTVEIVGRDKSQTATATRKTVDAVYALAAASTTDKQAITETTKHTLGAVSVGGYTQDGKPQTRQITNVAAGSLDSDAVNVAQLKAVANQITNAAGTHYYSVNSSAQGAGSNYNNDGATADRALAAGVNARATAFGATAVGNQAVASNIEAVAVGTRAAASNTATVAIGEGTKASGTSSIAIGLNTEASGNNSFVIGSGSQDPNVAGSRLAKASGEQAVAVGYRTQALNLNTTAIGANATAGSGTADARNATALGSSATASAASSLAVGPSANAAGISSVAVGRVSKTYTGNDIAIGSEAEAGVSAPGAGSSNAIAIGRAAKGTQAQAVAIGDGASVTQAHGIALGSGSVASVAASQVGADPLNAGGAKNNTTWTASRAALSVGNGTTITRQITGVAAGTNPTDAVNVAQLNTVANHTKNVGDTIVNVLGGDAAITPQGNITMGGDADGIGGTGKTNIDDAIKAATTKVKSDDKSVAVTHDAASNTYDLAVNTDGATITKDPATGALKANTTPLTVTDGKVTAPAAGSADAGKLATAGDIANAINNSGFNLTANGANGSLVKPGSTVDLKNTDGNIVISKAAGDNNVSFDLAPTVKIGPSSGGSPITIDGTAGSISGLSSNLPETTSTGTPTTAQAAPANPATGNAATVGDVLNAGWNLQGNGAAKDFVRAYDTVNFVNGTGTTVEVDSDGAVSTIKVNVNAQNLAESAQLPVVYTDAAGNKVYLVEKDDPLNPGTKIKVFNTTADGTGTDVDAANVIASMQSPDGKTVNAPTKLANVAPGVNDTDAVNVSQLKGAANALGGSAGINPDGSFKAPSYTINKTDGTPYAPVDNVGDALSNLNAEVVRPLTFAGDTGTNVERKLGSTVNVKGGVTDPAKLTDNNIGVVANGTDTLTIKLAENIDLGASGSVKMGDTTVNSNGLTINGGPSVTKTGINAGNKVISGVANGVAPTDAVNVSQLEAAAAAAKTTLTSNDKSVTLVHDSTNNSYDLAVNTDNTTIVKDSTTGALKANTTAINTTPDGQAQVAPANADKLATAGDIANAINNSGFNLTANGANGSLVKPGSTVDLKNTDGNIAISKAGTDNNVGFDLAPVLNVGPSTGGNPVTINGNAGTIGGLTNKTFDPTNFTSGQAATEDQLAQVAATAGKRNTVSAGSNIVVTPTTANGVTNFEVATNPNMTLTSVTTTDAAGNQTVTNGNGVTITPAAAGKAPVSLTGDGLNNGGNKITNVAEGTAGTDAVNVDQLNKAINNVNVTIPGQLNSRLNGIEGRLDKVENTANAGVAQAIATAGLPQAYLPGKSMVAVGGGYYRGETGYAVGFSTISDGGNWIIKGTASGNSRGHFGASVGAGYQW